VSDLSINWDKYHDMIGSIHLTKDSGKVTEVTGMLIKGYLPGASLGSICEIHPTGVEKYFLAEVIGFKDKSVLMMALGEMRGVGLGAKIILRRQVATVRVGEELLGRIVDGLGKPIDNKGDVEGIKEVSLYSEVRNPLDRKPIREPLDLGIRAINGALTVGQGQRVGIMAGSGVGRSVVICVTSDQSPLIRMRGAFVATAIAEYFSSLGKNVLLMMDSVTRFAMAQREIGLSAGEPPASKGYTPSVFSNLPKLLERAGSFENEGSITGLYTVLVEGDDMDDPIGDAVRSIVDGHIVLSRAMAQRGHFPAIDILQSASRVMRACVTSDHAKLAQKLREVLAVYKDAEDLINIGAYKPGSNPKIDRAIKLIEPLNDFLKQQVDDPTDFKSTVRSLQMILSQA
jgi:flagellum-specific ATP synthase